MWEGERQKTTGWKHLESTGQKFNVLTNGRVEVSKRSELLFKRSGGGGGEVTVRQVNANEVP